MTRRPVRRALGTVGLASALLLGAIGLRLLVYNGIDWPDALALELRALRALAATAIGLALATSGVLLQATLRNDLASPWVLGLTSGAGLGVAAWTFAAHTAGWAWAATATPIAPALLGACGALALVYALAHRRSGLDPATLILVGVMVGVMCGALTGFLQHLTPGGGLERYVRWMLGELDENARWPLVLGVLTLAACGGACAAWLGPSLDAASLGDDEAVSIGLNLRGLRVIVFLLAGVLTGSTILLAGPIGFVGLVCPHLARVLVGGGHRRLVIVAALLGAALLVGADAMVMLVPTRAGRAPLGVVTALIGAPVFIALLRRRGLGR